jgi:hypothetical protein
LGHLIKLLGNVPGKAGRPRLVILASGRCRAPNREGEAWKKVLEKKIRVDVLLIREEEKLAGKSVTHGNDWVEACGQTQGVVSFAQRGEKATLQQEVLAQLREWTRPIDK